MGEKVIKTRFKKIIIASLFILLFSICFILVKKNLAVDTTDFIIEGIVCIVVVNAFLISLDLRIRAISLGLVFIIISFLNDIVDEMKFITPSHGLYKLIRFNFEELFLAIGMIIFTYGFLQAKNQRQKFADNLKDLAFKDFLTDLPNRRSVKEKVLISIEEASKKSKKLAVLFIDLDEFKIINDTFGHNIGDELLKKVSIRLMEEVRSKDIVARMGGDEFVIIIHDIEDYNEAESIADRIIGSFKKPFELKGIHTHITCSIGISIFPDNGHDLDLLFKNADIAMYKAKEKGKNNYKFYTEAMSNRTIRKLEIAESLRAGLEKNEFYLLYQPKVSIETGQITGLEALLRWNHPKFGLLTPVEFIEIAEETGIIKEIDKYVLNLVCKQMKIWINRGYNPVNVSINISSQMFNERNFVKKIKSIIEKNSIDASLISLEITEAAAMGNKNYAFNVLNQFKNCNVKISLDNFGTGYSSLCYLKVFPLDVLKIDKTFVDGITKDKKDESIIVSIINMAKSLGIKVICEGVETPKQLKFLEDSGCDEYQGYLFSTPLTIQEIEEKLNYKEKSFEENCFGCNI